MHFNSDNFDPLWYSLGPLIIINILSLLTVLIFAALRKSDRKIPAQNELDNRHHSRFLSKWFKEYWFWVTSPIERIALFLKLTPNFFTTLGFVICFLSGLAFYYGRLGIAGWCVILGGTCDMFDGRIARITGKSTAGGAFYDSVMDRFGELASLVGLALYYRHHWMLVFVLLAIVGSMMVSYARARGQSVGVDCKEGVMQRPERIVYLGVSAIFSPIFAYLLRPYYALPLDFLLQWAVILIAVMTLYTSFSRSWWIYKALEGNKTGNS